MTGLDKVALLLKGLGPAAAELVLGRLAPADAARVRARLTELTSAPELQQSVRAVLREVAQALPDGGRPAEPAVPPKVNVVVGPSPEEDDEEEEELPGDPLAALARLPPPALAQALHGESPRTVALLLNLLETRRAGEVYTRLPADVRRDVSLYFATQPIPPAEVLRRVAQGVVQKFRALRDAGPAADQAERIKKMAELVRLLERAERAELLTALEGKDAAMAQQVKELLYQFDDLAAMENSSVQKLLAELDTKTLATALKGATPAVQHKVLTNLTKRAQDALKDEIDLLGSIAKAKVEQARKSVAEAIGRLDERGELMMVDSAS